MSRRLAWLLSALVLLGIGVALVATGCVDAPGAQRVVLQAGEFLEIQILLAMRLVTEAFPS